jgi:hypothetical protein
MRRIAQRVLAHQAAEVDVDMRTGRERRQRRAVDCTSS